MSKLEVGTAAWLVGLVVGVLGILFFPGIPKGKDWMDVVTLVVSAFAAVATAAAAIVALYIAWFQRRDLEVRAQRGLMEAGSGVSHQIALIVKALDDDNLEEAMVRSELLRETSRRLFGVQADIFTDTNYISALIHLRDIATTALAQIDLRVDLGLAHIKKLKPRLLALRAAAHKANWSVHGPKFVPPELDPYDSDL